jgi:hypothetical protein
VKKLENGEGYEVLVASQEEGKEALTEGVQGGKKVSVAKGDFGKEMGGVCKALQEVSRSPLLIHGR